MFYNNTPHPPASSDHGGRVVLFASQFSTHNHSKYFKKSPKPFSDKHIFGNLNFLETQALVFFIERMWAGKPWRSVDCFFENLEYEINTYQQDEMSFWILWVFGPLDIWKIEALEPWNFEACYWKNSSTPAHTDSHLCTRPPLFVWLCNPTGSELQWNCKLGARPSEGGRGCVEGMSPWFRNMSARFAQGGTQLEYHLVVLPTYVFCVVSKWCIEINCSQLDLPSRDVRRWHVNIARNV